MRMSVSSASASLPLRTPSRFLHGEVAPGWYIVRPLAVFVEAMEDAGFLVSDDLFSMYGMGATVEEALADYSTSLIDFYQILEARVESNPHNRPRFQHLQSYLLQG